MKITATIEAAIEQLASGGIVIAVDSADRENEGDFLAAAELITAETVHFMITHGRGHLCQPILPSTAVRLAVQPLVPSNGSEAPRFAMPVDSRDCATGISPLDRATTIRAIASSSSVSQDFVRPGHIFPLIARDGGVVERPGHTEAAIDLTRMSGLTPSGVLCEICSRDGRNMADLDELRQLAEEHDLPIIAIDDLIAYRRNHEDGAQVLQCCDELLKDLSAATRISVQTQKHSSSDRQMIQD